MASVVKCVRDCELDGYQFHKGAFYFSTLLPSGLISIGDDLDNCYAQIGNGVGDYFKSVTEGWAVGDPCKLCCEYQDRCYFYE